MCVGLSKIIKCLSSFKRGHKHWFWLWPNKVALGCCCLANNCDSVVVYWVINTFWTAAEANIDDTTVPFSSMEWIAVRNRNYNGFWYQYLCVKFLSCSNNWSETDHKVTHGLVFGRPWRRRWFRWWHGCSKSIYSSKWYFYANYLPDSKTLSESVRKNNMFPSFRACLHVELWTIKSVKTCNIS